MKRPGSISMHAGLRNGLAAALAVIVIGAGASSAAASAATGPVSGGPAGAGTCASQATTARTAASVVSLRAFGDCEIARRLTTLTKLSGVVAVAKGLTPAHAATLSSLISADRSGLTGLKTSIDAQTNRPALKLDVVQIVSKYRVYQLMGPQIRLVDAADGIVAIRPHFDGIASALADRIAGAKANGKDVSAAQADLAAMNTAAAAAATLAGPLPATLLALSPADFQSGAAQAALLSARTNLLKARDDLKIAAKDGRSVLADLK